MKCGFGSYLYVPFLTCTDQVVNLIMGNNMFSIYTLYGIHLASKTSIERDHENISLFNPVISFILYLFVVFCFCGNK